MRRRVAAAPFMAVFVVGALCGALLGHVRAGTWRTIHRTESFPFSRGEVALTSYHESTGMAFLGIDPETISLEIRTPDRPAVTIYRADRFLKDAFPRITDVRIDGDTIGWRDGACDYRLTVTPTDGGARP